MNGQIPLIIDSIYRAIDDTVRALGGSKTVAPQLWPVKKPEAAARYLDDCLNPNRAHKLDIEEILTIARLGREKGIYLITAFINADTGFAPPVAVDADDEKTQMQRLFVDGVDRLERLAKRIKTR